MSSPFKSRASTVTVEPIHLEARTVRTNLAMPSLLWAFGFGSGFFDDLSAESNRMKERQIAKTLIELVEIETANPFSERTLASLPLVVGALIARSEEGLAIVSLSRPMGAPQPSLSGDDSDRIFPRAEMGRNGIIVEPFSTEYPGEAYAAVVVE